MIIPNKYSSQLSLREQISYVLCLLKKATADEVSMELMELRGLSTKEGIAELTIEVENELVKMQDEHLIQRLTVPSEKTYYYLE